MASASDKKPSCSISSVSFGSSEPGMQHKVDMSRRNPKRRHTVKTENESSADSNFSEGTSDSEFEEHPYSSSKKAKMSSASSIKLCLPKSNVNAGMNYCGTNMVEKKRTKCTSKNAVMARLNRLKKKKYIQDLETKNAQLEEENEMLKEMLDRRLQEIESLRKKTSNLENVIRNSTEIGSLLKCIHQHTNLEISSSLLKNEPINSPDKRGYMVSDKHSLHSELSPKQEDSPNEDEGKEPLNCNLNKPVSSPLAFLDACDEADIDFGFSNPLWPGLDNLYKPSRLELPESSVSSHNDYDSSLFRCETPSKGFDACANKENLFGDVGVCFHIANKKVSLEFCDSCNQMASLGGI